MKDLIINFTPTGMIPQKADTPHVPVTVSEIIEDVHRACEKGITIVHLHARDEQTGKPTCRADMYGRIIEGIRACSKELVICVSLSGRDFPEIEKRMEPLTLEGNHKPDMGSLTLSSLNFPRQCSSNAPEVVQGLAAAMQQRGIVPELEAFDSGMVNYAGYLARKKLIQAPFYFNVILGNIASAQADLLHVGALLRDIPEGAFWSLGGIGAAQTRMVAVSIAMGGGVRIGLEDNTWLDTGRTTLATNMDLLDRVHALAAIHERPVMSSAAFRRHMHLADGHGGAYGRMAADPGPADA